MGVRHVDHRRVPLYASELIECYLESFLFVSLDHLVFIYLLLLWLFYFKVVAYGHDMLLGSCFMVRHVRAVCSYFIWCFVNIVLLLFKVGLPNTGMIFPCYISFCSTSSIYFHGLDLFIDCTLRIMHFSRILGMLSHGLGGHLPSFQLLFTKDLYNFIYAVEGFILNYLY